MNNKVILALLFCFFLVASNVRCKLGRQKYAKGAARHGLGLVLTLAIVAVNARIKKMAALELVIEVALDLLASAISTAK
ncbi:hypothetical protein P3S68_015496 [Capsicum galapagoense]